MNWVGLCLLSSISHNQARQVPISKKQRKQPKTIN